MKLVGVMLGEYEGHSFAKVMFLEPLAVERGRGFNCVNSKVVYDLGRSIANEWELWEDSQVNVYYDRFGRVNRIESAD